ncbi:MAG: Fe-S cluster assembly protein SufD, partial [Acidimicrobiales bacterium]
MGQARRDASAWIEEHGFPNTKDEDWRDLPLDPILGQSFEWSASRGADPSTASRAAEAVEAASLCRSATRLVFVNGRFAPVFSLLGDLPVGTTVSNLAADPERFHLLTARPDAEPTHAFSALNTTLAVDGAFVDLPAGTTLEEPIELIFLTDPGAGPLVSCPRSFIGLGEASRATIVETHGGLGGERYVTNA